MGLLVQTICRVTSVPHICSAHRKALQMCVINGRLSFHLAENTSTNQPLCRYISVHVPKANKPSITIMQQKRLCAESNYIRHAPECWDSWSDWWLFITHRTVKQVKVKQKTQHCSIGKNLCSHTIWPMHFQPSKINTLKAKISLLRR